MNGILISIADKRFSFVCIGLHIEYAKWTHSKISDTIVDIAKIAKNEFS